jgi:hypothetical protein
MNRLHAVDTHARGDRLEESVGAAGTRVLRSTDP